MQQQSHITDKGFTLIELLLAVFIASLVLVVLYASFFQILKAKEKVEQELELYHEARVVFSKMTKDLVTAFPRGRLHSDSNGSDFFVGTQEGNHSRIRFTSLSRSPSAGTIESDQTEISYFVVPSDENDQNLFALIRRDDPTIGTEGGGSEYPISENIVGFTLSYLGQTRVVSEIGEFKFEWDSNESTTIPNAVNVNLILRGPRGEDVEFNTLILIPVVN